MARAPRRVPVDSPWTYWHSGCLSQRRLEEAIRRLSVWAGSVLGAVSGAGLCAMSVLMNGEAEDALVLDSVGALGAVLIAGSWAALWYQRRG